MIDDETLPPLTRDEEARIIPLAQKGDQEALDIVVRANIRFANKMALTYRGQGLSDDDLKAEGYVGLLLAIERFDVSKGFKFITYAIWWIRQSVCTAIANSGIVRQPISRFSFRRDFIKARKRIEEHEKREVSVDEIIEAMGEEQTGRRADRREWLAMAQDVVSIDAPAYKKRHDEEGGSFHDILGADPQEDILDAVYREELRIWLLGLIDQLPQRDRRILRLYYGIEDGQKWTLEQVGGDIGVTRERIRQLRDAALARLKKRISEITPYHSECVTKKQQLSPARSLPGGRANQKGQDVAGEPNRTRAN